MSTMFILIRLSLVQLYSSLSPLGLNPCIDVIHDLNAFRRQWAIFSFHPFWAKERNENKSSFISPLKNYRNRGKASYLAGIANNKRNANMFNEEKEKMTKTVFAKMKKTGRKWKKEI